MKLTASLTDFDFDVIEGINGRDVPKKALSGVSRLLWHWRKSTTLTAFARPGKRVLVLEVKLAVGVDIWNLRDSELRFANRRNKVDVRPAWPRIE